MEKKGQLFFKDAAPLFCNWRYFQWEIYCHSHLCSSVHKCVSFLWLLLRIPFSLVLGNLILPWLCLVSIYVYFAWGLLNFFDVWIYHFIKFEKVLAIISSGTYSFFSFPLFMGIPITLPIGLLNLFYSSVKLYPVNCRTCSSSTGFCSFFLKFTDISRLSLGFPFWWLSLEIFLSK